MRARDRCGKRVDGVAVAGVQHVGYITAAAISAAVASTPFLFLSAQMTVAPSAANASAEALPMPDAAPRTSAVLPSSRNRLR